MGAYCFIYNRNGEKIENKSIASIKEKAMDIRADLQQLTYSEDGVFILSLETGLPIYSSIQEFDDVVVFGDIRIDNRDKLLGELNIDYPCNDFEIISILYKRCDKKFPHKIIGEFSFGIWDKKEKAFFGARDHIGIRAFLYSNDDDRFVCASDMELLLSVPEVNKEFDILTIADWYCSKKINNERVYHTFFENIKRLEPNHTLSVSKGDMNIDQYYCWNDFQKYNLKDIEHIKSKVLELLQESIKCRIAPSGKVGAHLSGGLDSSTISIILNRFLKQDKRTFDTFCWSPSPTKSERLKDSEYDTISFLEESENIKCHYTDLDEKAIENGMYHNPSIRPIYFETEDVVRRKARKIGVTQIFSGWGGDEGITHNGRSYQLSLLYKFKFFKLYRMLYERSSKSRYLGFKNLVKMVIHYLTPYFWYQKFTYKDHLSFLTDYTKKNTNLIDLKILKKLNRRAQKRKTDDIINTILITQIQLYKMGHIGMRCESWNADGLRKGIEYAFPLLDKRILELAIKIPMELYSHKTWGRWIFRKSIESIIPDSIAWRKTKDDPELFNRIDIMSDFRKVTFEDYSRKCIDSLNEQRYEIDIPFLNIENILKLDNVYRNGKKELYGKLFILLNLLSYK